MSVPSGQATERRPSPWPSWRPSTPAPPAPGPSAATAAPCRPARRSPSTGPPVPVRQRRLGRLDLQPLRGDGQAGRAVGRHRRPLREVRRAAALRSIRVQPEPQPGTAGLGAPAARAAGALPPPGGHAGRGVPLRAGDRPVASRTGAGVRSSPDVYGRPAVVFPLRDQAGEFVAVNVRHTDGRSDRRRTAWATGAWACSPPPAPWRPRRPAGGRRGAAGRPRSWPAATSPPWPWWAPGRRPGCGRRRPSAGCSWPWTPTPRATAPAGSCRASWRPSPARVERLRPPTGKDWNDALLADYPALCTWLEGAGV